MNTRGLLVTIFAVALSVAPQLVSTSSAAGTYSATLISPRVGQVLYPGQKIRVEWRSTLPNIDLAGVRDGSVAVAGWRENIHVVHYAADWTRKLEYFDWTVPNLPTNAAVMDIRFGCEPWYPESYAPQPASTFVIAKAVQASH